MHTLRYSNLDELVAEARSDYEYPNKKARKKAVTDFDQLAACFEKYGIVKAAVFGSASRGDMKQNSDVDIIVSFARKYDLLDLVGLKQDLEEEIHRPVDLITYDALKDDSFGQNVL